jgi:hypothetical protein
VFEEFPVHGRRPQTNRQPSTTGVTSDRVTIPHGNAFLGEHWRFNATTKVSGGRLLKRGKTPVWVGIFREDRLQAGGTIKRVQRSVVLGHVADVSQRAAWKAFQPYLDSVNSTVMLPPKAGITLDAFVKEWRTSVAVNLKGSTARAAESHLRAQSCQSWES